MAKHNTTPGAATHNPNVVLPAPVAAPPVPATPPVANNGHKRTVCPISRQQFDEATPVEVVINGVPMLAECKRFATGSMGWYLTGKTTLRVGDTPCSVQVGLNLTIVGSKELP